MPTLEIVNLSLIPFFSDRSPCREPSASRPKFFRPIVANPSVFLWFVFAPSKWYQAHAQIRRGLTIPHCHLSKVEFSVTASISDIKLWYEKGLYEHGDTCGQRPHIIR